MKKTTNEMLCGCSVKRGEGIVFCVLHSRARAMAKILGVLRDYYAKNMPDSPFLDLVNGVLGAGEEVTGKR
jgi:hypothetical protein